MYEAHFGFRELPFTLTPNTHFYLNAATHQRAFQTVKVALESLEGFIKVVGEVGTGKTLLCRALLGALQSPFYTAYIPNPCLEPQDLYCVVARELDMDVAPESRTHVVLDQIQTRLIELAADGRQVVLLIDEAQALPEATIEAVRLLTNLETESRKLLQVVLFGQPELDVLLDQPHLRQLKQRITFQERLQPLSRDEVAQYVRHRISAAGYNGPDLFDSKALRAIAHSSGGIPRLVNILSHKALLAAYGEGARQVRRAHVKRAVNDTESAGRLPWYAGVFG
ncbi:MAG: AAA family ATPase [Gammaproteobacteria bacterium]|nr:MAG: AAA family ATPase [Gammaproteobacteria bacterium]